VKGNGVCAATPLTPISISDRELLQNRKGKKVVAMVLKRRDIKLEDG